MAEEGASHLQLQLQRLISHYHPDLSLIAPFDPTKKKKKKKKVVIQQHVDGSDLYNSLERDILPLNEGGRKVTLGLTEKKKSVGTSMLLDGISDATGHTCDSDEENEEADALVQQYKYPWEGSERDYEYKEFGWIIIYIQRMQLLQRVFSFMHKHNPQLSEDKRRSVLRPPQVIPEGTTKTVCVNFIDLCQTMHRQPEQVITFMLTELGTGGSLDGENRLVVRGRFAPKRLEDLLQTYINEYVLCKICRSPDTGLSKENHIVLLQCDLCGSERSVAPVGAGYGSRIERRKTGI